MYVYVVTLCSTPNIISSHKKKSFYVWPSMNVLKNISINHQWIWPLIHRCNVYSASAQLHQIARHVKVQLDHDNDKLLADDPQTMARMTYIFSIFFYGISFSGQLLMPILLDWNSYPLLYIKMAGLNEFEYL